VLDYFIKSSPDLQLFELLLNRVGEFIFDSQEEYNIWWGLS